MRFLIFLVLILSATTHSIAENHRDLSFSNPRELTQLDSAVPVALESWTYTEDFEDRELGAWASYPLWQDIAYNQNFRVNEIIPGDPNISIVQKVTPYTAVDNYAGAQKLLDMFLVPGSSVRFRYFLKSNQSCTWMKVRFAAGELGKLDAPVVDVKTNEWQWVTMHYDDFVKDHPNIVGQNIRIFALAFLSKFEKADPDMPIYLGLDDITFSSARPVPFAFETPAMHKLPEIAEFIPTASYTKGNKFELAGKWIPELTEVSLEISTLTNQEEPIYRTKLDRINSTWSLNNLKLDFPAGVYRGLLKGNDGGKQIAQTSFTIHITSGDIEGQHPRLLFDVDGLTVVQRRFETEPYQKLRADIISDAQSLREKIPVESLQYDLDQFPDEDWLPTWDAWGSRIYHTGSALRANARAYAISGDTVAGAYARDILVTLSHWPDWTHPWQTKRGRYSEHRTGSWSHRVAEAYDLVYDLMGEDESTLVRKAIIKNFIAGVHRTYIYNDNITAATSNWLAMTVGGSLMCLSAIYDDGPETQNLEPYFTGAVLKLNKFLNKVTDSKDGAWGEGFGYNNYSLSNLSYSLPSLENVFNVDLSTPLIGTYNEYIWAGQIKAKRWFEYGDGKGDLNYGTNWAYLLSKYKNPRLSWFYHFLQSTSQKTSLENLTYEDAIFNTIGIPEKDPFDLNPVKLFRDIGTTVFKSGWDADDFVFVMRTGAAYNHQHLDQGSFWLADHGKVFVEERSLGNSHYYDDPIYESWLTQPVGHSTILINGNHQSQRVGDHLDFAPGFDDHAFVSHFLDGKNASFVTGDIGRLYWGKVKSLSRNVLYLKPGTLLMLDVAVPTETEDAEVTLLYQTEQLKDIHPDQMKSDITKEGVQMHVYHPAPENLTAKAVETPHYLKTLRNVRPLEKEGMLTIQSETNGEPLVMANLIKTTKSKESPKITTSKEEGFTHGQIDGRDFAFSTSPMHSYTVANFTTDALAATWDQNYIFLGKAKSFKDSNLGISSTQSLTLEIDHIHRKIKYYSDGEATVNFEFFGKEKSLIVNDVEVKIDRKQIEVSLPKGDGEILLK